MSPTKAEPAPDTPPEPRLTRRLDERVVAGVAAGIAHYFSFPVWLVRVAFVALTFLVGTGLWLYILAAFAMPPTGVDRPDAPIDRAARWIRRAPIWLWVGLILAGIVLVVGVYLPEGRGSLVAGLAFLVAGAAVLAPRRERATVAGPEILASATISTPPGHDVAPSQPRRRRERSGLGWMSLGVAIVAVGFAVLLDRAGTVDVQPQQYLALPVLILGAGMLVGARWGRAKWLMIPALLLTPPLLLASVIDVPFTGGYAERYERPRTLGEVAPLYQLSGGRQAIDLRHLDLRGGRPIRISAQVAVGNLDVWIPASAELDLQASADWGYVQVVNWSGPGAADYGFQLDVERSIPGRKAGGAILLDLRVGIGQIQVFRGYPETWGSWTY